MAPDLSLSAEWLGFEGRANSPVLWECLLSWWISQPCGVGGERKLWAALWDAYGHRAAFCIFTDVVTAHQNSEPMQTGGLGAASAEVQGIGMLGAGAGRMTETPKQEGD